VEGNDTLSRISPPDVSLRTTEILLTMEVRVFPKRGNNSSKSGDDITENIIVTMALICAVTK
jgi:hypothetical protein